jgi:hypothetical protein
MIVIPLILFLLAFGNGLYDRHMGRPVSFTDISGIALGLFFLYLGLLALYSQLASRQRSLEEKLNLVTRRPENPPSVL